MKLGDRVRMTEATKERLRANNCAEHVAEFGKCIGIIVARLDRHKPIGWDVRWQPSNLRYGYLEESLEIAP